MRTRTKYYLCMGRDPNPLDRFLYNFGRANRKITGVEEERGNFLKKKKGKEGGEGKKCFTDRQVGNENNFRFL